MAILFRNGWRCRPGRRVSRSYAYDGEAGCVAKRKLDMGVTVGLYHAEQAGIDNADGEWVLKCEEHESMLWCETLKDAREHMPLKEGWMDWCLSCDEIMLGRYDAMEIDDD